MGGALVFLDFEPGFCLFLPGEDVVGRKQAFALERAYESHDFLFLTTSTDDALRFYKRLGFDEVGYITDMHAPGNNEHLLRKMKR